MRHRPHPAFVPILVLTVVAGAASGAALAASQAADVPAPADRHAFATGRAALQRLGDRLPDVALAHGADPIRLAALLLSDATLAVDRSGNLAYFDLLAPGEPAADAATSASLPESAPPVTGPEFQLASLPGADKTIFLDFDGHVTTGTTWNSAYGLDTIVSPPYDTNGNPDSWSSAELRVIRDSWATVAEDFAPWNVNVTTIDPGTEALRRSGTGDSQWGARVVITADTFASCGCGGHAYIGAFDDPADEPTFVYNTGFIGVAEAITHEVGHMLNLAHDGTTSGSAYYLGHPGAGDTGWAPIMGAAYYQPVSQWSQQEYSGANNTGAGANYGHGDDDVAVISSLTNGNGFGPKPDDHPDSAASATPLNGDQPSVDGIIGTRSDVDVFGFTTSGGDVTFTGSPAALRPNLDIALTLRDADGAVVATSNPADLLSASLSATLAPGSYTIAVDGVGVGTPAVDPPSGYTDYGSIGQYTLAGTIGGVAPPDTDPPAPPTGLTAVDDAGAILLNWAPNAEPDVAGYVVRRSASSGGPFTDLGTVAATTYRDTAAPGGTSYYVVAARDTSGNVSTDSEEAAATLPLTSGATGETPIAGSVTGSHVDTHVADGVVQTITEIDSGGKPSKRHDLAEHRWALPASQGNQTLTVVATATEGGDEDEGFSLEWSNDGTTWIPLDTIMPGRSDAREFAIGAPTGTVWVRVVDTDRTAGERAHDTVAVDLIALTGDGGPVDPVEPTQAVATVTTSTIAAGKGTAQGVATVRVLDDQGSPVGGALVTVQFSGSFGDRMTVTTTGDGIATAVTAQAVRKPSFSACVVSVTAAGLAYAPGTEAC